jgi:hypothetical protein
MGQMEVYDLQWVRWFRGLTVFLFGWGRGFNFRLACDSGATRIASDKPTPKEHQPFSAGMT